MTDRELIWTGIGIGVLGLLYELFYSPKAQARAAASLAAGRSLGPLGDRPLNTQYNTLSPYPPAKMSVTTPYSRNNPSPQASGGGGLLGQSFLPSLTASLNKLFSGGTASAAGPQSRGSAGGQAAAPSLANVGYARGSSPQGSDGRTMNYGPVDQLSAGPGPQGLTPYVDDYGQTAYPNGDGTFADDYGNQVWIDADGHLTYDFTESVGYVTGGEVFPDSTPPDVTQNAMLGVSASDPLGAGLYLAPDSPDAPSNQSASSDQGDTGPSPVLEDVYYYDPMPVASADDGGGSYDYGGGGGGDDGVDFYADSADF